MTHDNNCPLCGHEFVAGTTLFSADLGTGILVVKEVPAFICVACGNKFFENSVFINLEKLAASVKDRRALVEVLVYKAA